MFFLKYTVQMGLGVVDVGCKKFESFEEAALYLGKLESVMGWRVLCWVIE